MKQYFKVFTLTLNLQQYAQSILTVIFCYKTFVFQESKMLFYVQDDI
jgi:hypothetical protein